jgi:hypothetical protein
MALSTLNPPLLALEGPITLTPRLPQPILKTPTKKKLGPRLSRDIRRDILLLRELNDNDDEIEYAYERIATVLSRRHGRKVTLRGVQYTVNSHKATSKKEERYHSSYENLRSAIKKAWDAIGAEELLALIRETLARCQAAIDAQGRHTKY